MISLTLSLPPFTTFSLTPFTTLTLAPSSLTFSSTPSDVELNTVCPKFLDPEAKRLMDFFCYVIGPEITDANTEIQLAVSNWSSRGNNCTFANFFYRIGQAFLAIFGKSDWQKARKSLDAFIFDKLKDNKNVPPGLYSLISKCSDQFMKILLKFNDSDKKTELDLVKFGIKAANDLYKFAVAVSGDVADLAIVKFKQMGFTPEKIIMVPMFVAKAPTAVDKIIDRSVSITQAQTYIDFFAAADKTPKNLLNDVSPALAKVGLDANLVWNTLAPILVQKGIKV